MEPADLLNLLNTYVNNGYFGHLQGSVSVLFPRLPFRMNAPEVSELFRRQSFLPASSEAVALRLPFYNGSNTQVLELIRALGPFSDQLAGAYVHGSLGSGEEIPYSDMDLLAVIRDEVVRDPKKLASVAYGLSQMRRIMRRQDPLQHHGWFVLTESILQNYPEEFLPIGALHQAQALIGGREGEIRFRLTDTADFRAPFRRLCNSIRRKTADASAPRNTYAAKNLLSEFMLLPARYLQAKTGAGCGKKESFTLLAAECSADEYRIMEEASALRSLWKREWAEGSSIRSVRNNYLWNERMKRRKEVLPAALQNFFSENNLRRMSAFVQMLEQRIG